MLAPLDTLPPGLPERTLGEWLSWYSRWCERAVLV